MGDVSPQLEFRRVVVEPAYKAVSAAIERAIIDGALLPGSALPTEHSLSQRFGVHRSTVREAIRQVEQEGLLQRGEGRRLFVCLPGVDDLAPRATRLLLLQQTTFQELWDVAAALEPLAARLAATQAADDDLALLHANLDATERETDHAPLVRLDVAFHALVGRASHSADAGARAGGPALQPHAGADVSALAPGSRAQPGGAPPDRGRTGAARCGHRRPLDSPAHDRFSTRLCAGRA